MRFRRDMPQDSVRRNEMIRAREVRVIAADGEQLGILQRNEAIVMAKEAGMDLVEVSSNSEPPVCRIMDYGKFKYEQQKKKQEAKKRQAVVQIKEIKVRPKTDDHDYETKVRHIRRFLEEGDRCKITVFFRGREIVQIGVHHIDGPLLVGHVPHGVQGVVGQLWKYLGGHQAAVRSQSLGDCLRRRAPVFLVPRAYIVHTSLTTLIRFSKNRARTSASL